MGACVPASSESVHNLSSWEESEIGRRAVFMAGNSAKPRQIMFSVLDITLFQAFLSQLLGIEICLLSY